jgi:hypothetical protein
MTESHFDSTAEGSDASATPGASKYKPDKIPVILGAAVKYVYLLSVFNVACYDNNHHRSISIVYRLHLISLNRLFSVKYLLLAITIGFLQYLH